MAYTSEFTQFMTAWLEAHPEQRDEQKTGRALWWDKPQSVSEQDAFKQARVAQKPYPYQAD